MFVVFVLGSGCFAGFLEFGFCMLLGVFLGFG